MVSENGGARKFVSLVSRGKLIRSRLLEKEKPHVPDVDTPTRTVVMMQAPPLQSSNLPCEVARRALPAAPLAR